MAKTKKSKEFIDLCKKYGVDHDNLEEVKTFEDACAITGYDPEKLPVVDHLPEEHRKRLIADYKLTVIAQAIRGNKKVDYTDGSWKPWPYFIVEATEESPSGVGLSFRDYAVSDSASHVGVRLCFLNEDQAIYFGQHFIELHKEHHLYS